jgi:hypothetical protein
MYDIRGFTHTHNTTNNQQRYLCRLILLIRKWDDRGWGYLSSIASTRKKGTPRGGYTVETGYSGYVQTLACTFVCNLMLQKKNIGNDVCGGYKPTIDSGGGGGAERDVVQEQMGGDQHSERDKARAPRSRLNGLFGSRKVNRMS